MEGIVKVDIISDVMCPWCIVGYKRLETAIDEMGLQEKVQIEWHPFELNPNETEEGEDTREHMEQKYAMTPKESKEFQTQITSLAQEVGFTFDFDKCTRIVNSRDCHILLQFAREHDRQTELKIRLFTAHFTEGKNVASREQLLKEVEAVGLNVEEAYARLNDNSAVEQLRKEERHWQQAGGITAVPTMIFNGFTRLIGAQPVDDYKKLLKKLTAKK
jgi:predicted DsbA family dithiol-disulfide isomerase